MSPADCRFLWLETAESYGCEKLQLVTDEVWDGLTITATFVTANSAVKVLVARDGTVIVPPEATACATGAVPAKIVFSGVVNGVQRISCDLPYKVAEHAQIDGAESVPPTPSEWQQFVDAVKTDAERVDKSAEEAGAFAKSAQESAAQSSNSAKSSAASAAAAKTSESNASASAANAAKSADLAQQGAASAGFFYFEFGENGHVYLVRTENTPPDIDFKIDKDGRLIAVYGKDN